MPASAAAIAFLQGCAALFGEPDWRFGAPPPPLPVTAYSVEGEVRDRATLAPIPDAEIVLTTGREGYEAHARSDPAGRFSVGFSALEKDVEPGDAAVEALLFGSDSSYDLTREISIQVKAPGRPPAMVRHPLERVPKPLVVYMERFSGDEAIERINRESWRLGSPPSTR